MKINNKSDKQIDEAISLRESGVKDREILTMFPDLKDEIAEIFEIMDMLAENQNKIMPSQDVLRKVLISTSKQNKTESILRPDNKTHQFDVSADNINNNSYKNKGRVFCNIFNLISNIMNKKTSAGLGIIVIMLVLTIGASIALKNRKNNILNNQNLAIEKEITDEKKSFDKESADMDELSNDTSAEEVGSGLADIENDVKAASVTSTAELDSIEKDFAYEIDSVSSDLDSKNGIENDASLNSFSTDIGGI